VSGYEESQKSKWRKAKHDSFFPNVVFLLIMQCIFSPTFFFIEKQIIFFVKVFLLIVKSNHYFFSNFTN